MTSQSYVVIGGGIIGSTIARELATRQYGDVVVLEKEECLGKHASGRNSGVLHSGINQKPGSIKATMCVEGNKRARQYCKEHKIPMEECGTLVVARDSLEEGVLQTLYERGREAGVEALSILGQEELKEREPYVVGKRALLSPNGAIVNSNAFLREVSREAQQLGATYVMGAEVYDVIEEKPKTIVLTTNGEYRAEHVINCAGLQADKIAYLFGVGLEYKIVPFRGDYRELKNIQVNGMVYQAPDLRYPFLGVHLTKTTDNIVLGGPTATLSLGRESYDGEINRRNIMETIEMAASLNFWRLLVSEEFIKLVIHNAKISLFESAFLDEIRTLCPSVTAKDITPAQSGIRAQMVDRMGRLLDDMLVDFREHSIHILNAVSPGMTSSLAFAEYVVDRINRGT